MGEKISIDAFVDYRAEYEAAIKKCEISGDKLIGLCPFHDDNAASFSVDLKTGRWHCFAEDISGNILDFFAKLHGTTTKDEYVALLAKYNISNDKPQKPSYTLSQYAFEKRLPEAWLKENFRLSSEKNKEGIGYVKIPYYNELKQESTHRKRYANKEFRWKYGSSGHICLYNEWRLEDYIRPKGYVILVEGESDTQTLTYLDLPALGVPGASMFKSNQAKLLQDLKVYIHKEPDQGGEVFVNKVRKALKEGDFIGEAYIWGCSRFGCKDPSDLYMTKGADEAKKNIKKAIEHAEKIDVWAEEIPNIISDQPLGLKQPEGWVFSEKGISVINNKEYMPTLVCRTPIIITKRLRNRDTGEEKIEIAFKRDGSWHKAAYPRSTIFTSRNITVLADLGCTVTSENAKKVVQFLSALEAENIDIIPKVTAVGTFGWQSDDMFIPGHAEGIELDIDPSQRGLVAAYCQAGSYDKWKERINIHRENEKFRFILAASFAAPLLKILKQRIFFVYNWGDSKGGKTAALKAALSVWGEPEKLMMSFNATQVGLERTAALYCDLPLGIDERQLAGNSTYAQNSLEKTVYMIASGQGKVRGSKGGGLQQTHQWRTVAIATGEEPIASSTSQSGVNTRIIEICGSPFDGEADASRIHQFTAINYGWAGNDFINHLIQTDKSEICDLYAKLTTYIQNQAKGKLGSHVNGIAAVSLADALADHWIFRSHDDLKITEDTWLDVKNMADKILSQQLSEAEANVNENAAQYIADWIMSNYNNFGENSIGVCFGFVMGNKAYVYPSLLNSALKKAGFSPKKTLKYLADKGIVACDNNGGHTTYSVVKWFNGRTSRFVEFDLSSYAKEKDPLSSEDEIADENIPPGFVQMEIDDEQLPF